MKKILVFCICVITLSCNSVDSKKVAQEGISETIETALNKEVRNWQTTIDGEYSWMLAKDRCFVQAIILPGATEPYIVTRTRRPGEKQVDTFYLTGPNAKYTIYETNE